MSEQIKLIKELIDYVESYKVEVGNSDIKEFSVYLRDKVLCTEPKAAEPEPETLDYMKYKDYPEVEFSTLLTSLYRFARHYVKKAFTSSSIKTLDEFGFLATLLKEKSLLKNELITRHIMEMSSGSEILKRLIKNNLVYEYPDARDKRAKRVSLTEKGFQEVVNAFNDMHKVSEIVIGNLSQTEITEAITVLNKLNFYHLHIHQDDKSTDLMDIHQKYVKPNKP